MRTMALGTFAPCVIACWLPPEAAAARSFPAGYDRAFSLRQRTADLVFRAEIKPHWLADNHQFWYRVQTGPQTHEFILVDAGTGARQPAFDRDKLARSLASTTGQRMRADNLLGAKPQMQSKTAF